MSNTIKVKECNKKFKCSFDKGHSLECQKYRRTKKMRKWYQKKKLLDPKYDQKVYARAMFKGSSLTKEFGVGKGNYTRDPNKHYGKRSKIR